jgi:serine/threonine protein kinase
MTPIRVGELSIMTIDKIRRSIGGYQLAEEIGSSSRATIYKAYQPHLERWVAVKVLPKLEIDQLIQFQKEAQAISHLRHRNIIIVYDYGEQEKLPYIVMEYVEGDTLKDILSHKPLDWVHSLDLLIPIAEGLAYAHQQGVIHRNIKPSNILIPRNNWPLLSDFALTKFAKPNPARGAPTVSPAYMAPEQVQNQSGLDHRVDIYSLGAVLFEMVTGRPPFDYQDPTEILLAHMSEPVPPLRQFNVDCPPILELIVITAMKKSADHRYQTMSEMVSALKDALASSDVRPIFYGTAARASEIKTNLLDSALTIPPLVDPPPHLLASQSGQARLFLIENKVSISVPDKASVIIGRTHRNIVADIDLGPQGAATAGVSRRHARLTQRHKSWLVDDLDSLNGTFVNNAKLVPGEPVPLKDGDEIRCGRLAFLFLLNPAS